MSTCLGKMMIEEDQELAPQLKKMKLTSESSQAFEVSRASFIGKNLTNELKMAFPYFSEEVNLFN
jgi:hypothetical protein